MSATTEAKSNSDIADAHDLLENCMFAALETYANVHRGSDPASAVTTHLYEKARNVVLNYLGLNLGEVALAVKQSALPKGIPPVTGGGNTRLYGSDDAHSSLSC